MHRRIDALETGFDQLTYFLAALVAASIGLIALLIPLNLLLVRLQWGSIWWLYEAVEYTLYVGVCIGAPWVLRQGAHVRMDILATALPRRQSVWVERGVDVAGLLLSLLLCYYGVRAALAEFADGTLPDKDLRIANWYMLSVFAGSFFLIAVEFLFRLRRVGTAADDDAASSSGF